MNYIFYAFRLQVFPSGNKLLPSHVGKATRVVVFRPFVFRHFSIFSLLFLLPFYKLSGLLSCCRDAVLRRLCGIMNWVSESCQVMCMHMKDSFLLRVTIYNFQRFNIRIWVSRFACPRNSDAILDDVKFDDDICKVIDVDYSYDWYRFHL